jgi:hypothetical protein
MLAPEIVERQDHVLEASLGIAFHCALRNGRWVFSGQ